MGAPLGGSAAAQAATDLRAFARTLRARLRWNAAWTAAAHALLRSALPCLILGLVGYRYAPTLGAVGAAVWLLAGGAAGFMAARRAAAVGDAAMVRLLAWAGADPALLARLGDELATFCESPTGREAVRRWLEQSVQAGVLRVPPAACARVGRRPFGRELLAVPLAALLLWLAWFHFDLPGATWPGLQPAPAVPRAAALPPEPEPTPQPPRSGAAATPLRAAAPDPASPSAPDAPPPAPPPAAEPATLLELPPLRRFVVPRFVDDGPTRRARVHAVDAEQGAAGSAGTGAAGAGAPAADSRSTREEFARAAEQALASRHVPPSEQPIVRRFFEALQKAAP